jgi:hypothetical protein
LVQSELKPLPDTECIKFMWRFYQRMNNTLLCFPDKNPIK